MPPVSADPGARAARKADLLLASALLRQQVQVNVDDLGDRADRAVNRVLSLREWLGQPAVLAGLGAAAAFFAASGERRRGQAMSALRWAWRAWRWLRR